MQRPLTTLGLVVLGGAAGAGLRAAVVLPLGDPPSPLVVPGVTLVVNVVGAFLLGVVVGRLHTHRPMVRAFLGTGVLGGFTTYSAFAVQTVALGTQAPVFGLLLVVLTLVVGTTVAAAGLRVGRRTAGMSEPPEDAE